MSQNSDFIRANTLALALGVSEVGLTGLILRGRVPRPDVVGRFPHPKTRAWRFESLQSWRPDVAARCTALVAVLEDIPLKPKAGRKVAKP